MTPDCRVSVTLPLPSRVASAVVTVCALLLETVTRMVAYSDSLSYSPLSIE